jgi:hypothetical protein
MTTAVKPGFVVIKTAADLRPDAWPFGTVVQEVHDGDCCDVYHFCDVYASMWHMSFDGGWARSGNEFDPGDQPRLPVQLIFVPDGS